MIELFEDKSVSRHLKDIFEKLPVPVNFVDKDSRIIYINKAFTEFLGIGAESAIGKKTKEIEPTSKLEEVIKYNKAEIACKHTFNNGKTAIVHRIPLLGNEGEIIGCFGMVLFENMDEMKEVMKKYKLLHNELKLYKNTINRLNTTKYNLYDIIGESKEMRFCKRKVKKIAKVNMNVLICGESGVGKELFAHSIHNESDRKNNPFVSINCSAIPDSLFESELFGYIDGSFTGGKKGGNLGKFQLADGGTIFLDEIGEMPHHMQAKLLRVLQEKEIQPIGAVSPVKIDVRVVCATHQNIEKMVEDKEFREDLYYRLNVLNLDIPPLRERKEDIPLLVERFAADFYKNTGFYRIIDEDAMKIFMKHNWPGNCRELKNVVEKVCVNADETKVKLEDFPSFMRDSKFNASIKKFDSSGTLKDIMDSVEREIVEKTLKECNYNKTLTAKKLNIPRATLYRKIEEYSIDCEL